MPYWALPFTLSGVSRRFAGVPINVKSFGSLSGTLSGTGSLAAFSAREPYGSVRPVGVWVTTPRLARHDAGSTSHVWAAAATSMVRAVAPARRNGSTNELTLDDPAVSGSPNNGVAQRVSAGGAFACATRVRAPPNAALTHAG